MFEMTAREEFDRPTHVRTGPRLPWRVDAFEQG
jgi:hypothetical protein